MTRIILCAAIFCANIFIAEKASAQTDSVKTATIKVINLHCGNDMPTIKRRLLNQEGIDEVKYTELSGETSTFTITYHSSVTDQQKIERFVETTPGCDNKNETPYRVKKSKKDRQ